MLETGIAREVMLSDAQNHCETFGPTGSDTLAPLRGKRMTATVPSITLSSRITVVPWKVKGESFVLEIEEREREREREREKERELRTQRMRVRVSVSVSV